MKAFICRISVLILVTFFSLSVSVIKPLFVITILPLYCIPLTWFLSICRFVLLPHSTCIPPLIALILDVPAFEMLPNVTPTVEPNHIANPDHAATVASCHTPIASPRNWRTVSRDIRRGGT